MADTIGHEGEILTTTFEHNWYWYFESLFWPEQIMRIREICERGQEEEALTFGIDKPENANHIIRKNKVSWHDNEELYSMMRPVMQEVNQESGWNYNITAIEPMQYTVYYGDENHYEKIVNFYGYLKDEIDNVYFIDHLNYVRSLIHHIKDNK